MFVDAKVGEVHVSFFDVFDFGVILVSGKSCKSFVKHIDFERVITSYQDVDSKIILKPVDKMRVMNIFGDKCILFAFYFRLLIDHLNTPPTCLVRGFHNPESSFLSIFPYHLESIKVSWKQVSDRHEIIVLRKTTTLLVEMLPHVILTSKIPTPRKVVILLKPLHGLNCFEMCAANVEEYVPITTTLNSGKPIELQRVHYTLVLMTRYFIGKVWFLYWNYSTRLLFLYTTAFWIMEKYRTRSILKSTLHLISVSTSLILCYRSVFLTVHVHTVIQLLTIHPYTLEGLFTVGLAQVDGSLHAFGLNELNFRCHLDQILLRLDSFLILND